MMKRQLLPWENGYLAATLFEAGGIKALIHAKDIFRGTNDVESYKKLVRMRVYGTPTIRLGLLFTYNSNLMDELVRDAALRAGR